MSDTAVDSSVGAKWVLDEPDSEKAEQLFAGAMESGGQLILLDIAFSEITNAIWKQHRRKRITLEQARKCLGTLEDLPVGIVPATKLLVPALEIAMKYDRAVYDALFVALSNEHNLKGVTADEPLYNSVHAAYPNIVLLRDL